MVSYLIDTNVCIALMRRVDQRVATAYEKAVTDERAISLSTVVLFELEYGIARSRHLPQNRERLERFLSLGIAVLPVTRADAVAAAQVRAELERRKQPIGPFDTLIAGQAMARGLTLVTANVREFGRVKGLRWEDWSAQG